MHQSVAAFDIGSALSAKGAHFATGNRSQRVAGVAREGDDFVPSPQGEIAQVAANHAASPCDADVHSPTVA